MDQLKASVPNSIPLTPLSFLERAAVVYADCPSIVYDNTTCTWSQTHVRCLQIASSISSLGLGRGDVVSVLAPNVPAAYELHFGVPMCGAVLNNLNTRLDSRTVSVLLQHSESKLVFVYEQFLSLVLDALSLFPSGCPHPILVLIQENEKDPCILIPSQITTASTEPVSTKTIRDLTEFRCGQPIQILTTYEEMVRKGDPNFEWVQPESEWTPIVLNYTSGTTSSPKGVVHCHRGTFITAMDSLIDWSVPTQPVFLWTLPMFHSNGWSFTWGMAAVGGTNICLRRFDGASVHAAIRAHHVTHMCAAPVVLNMLLNLDPTPQPLPNPVHILTGGSPPPVRVILRAESLGFAIKHGYGMTETAGVIISCAWKTQWDKLPASDRAQLKARQGVRTLGMSKMDVVDPKTGRPVNRDGKSVGEIVLRGGSVMLGYLKDPIGTSKCITKDRWFRTGDLGVIHPDGYLEIKDRSKDIIISGGENISSVEVEAALYAFPAVNEAAVVARPDEFWGETPCAFVSLKRGGEDGGGGAVVGDEREMERRIIEHCRETMPHYMVPKTVVFKAELPKTSTGKIQKFVLRKMAHSLGVDDATGGSVSSSLASRL